MFAVAPSTLELYGQRGTVPFFTDGQGRRLFDAEAVASIFRRRGTSPVVAPERSFGRLGSVTLGEPPLTAPPTGRSGSFTHAR